jgi:hypothetical protein
MEDPSFDFQHRQESFSFPKVQTGSGAHALFYSMGITVSIPHEIKRPEHKADNSPPPNAEVTNEWSYTSTPTIGLCRYVMYRHNFTYYVPSSLRNAAGRASLHKQRNKFSQFVEEATEASPDDRRAIVRGSS